MKRDVLVYLEDMYSHGEKALALVQGMTFEDFKKDWKTQFALIRALEVMGEAARYVPESFRQQHPEIPWRGIVGLRNVLIHRYFHLNLEAIWQTVHGMLPDVLQQLQNLLQERS